MRILVVDDDAVFRWWGIIGEGGVGKTRLALELAGTITTLVLLIIAQGTHRQPFFDLALLQIPAQKDLKFQFVYLARENDQREGDEVFAIGNPLGLERSVSQGIISTRNRNFNGITFIQTTAEINPGNSGGPLFNLRGEVVGVTNMKLQFSEGLGFAIPIAYVKHFLDNRDAFAFDKNNPNTGFRYLEAPRRKTFSAVPAATASAGK
jgi:serine protease Do